ncbi:uncharacterized protein LOC113232626 [Hyposmocoma kahamanoa]|uniref:uncharacterized protein LOC113232626 n=1 Tax=Hyposmocoma kahamanoa TaxID=1477025 RepID=UPI000E6D8285|nr:uncharacterized protein LOC113232626 [Hyposmocoma kahamanoa]
MNCLLSSTYTSALCTQMFTMESKIHRNAILTGYVDAYCLICENLLRTEDIFKHIDKPIHMKNLLSSPYVNKYKGEYIRKVKQGYYCEFCNILFPTTAKVNLHIAEATHIQNKGAPVVKRVGNSLIALNDIYINEKAWNGLIEDICALCNLEFNNENIHKTEQNHILNLIQKKVQFLDKKAVYRMVDNESFQCLTCNMIFALSAIETHFGENNHKNMFQKCRENPFEPAIIVQQSDKKALKNLDDASKEIANKSTLKTPNTQQAEQNLGNTNMKTNRSEPKYGSKTNVNATAKMEEAMGHVMKPNFDQNHNDTVKYGTTGEEEAQNMSLNILDVPKNLNQTLATSTPTESQTSRREINDEKARKIHYIQKVVKSAKPNDTLNEVPKKSILETFNPTQMENKPDKNKNSNPKITTSELKHESKTNVNATAKMKEAVGHVLKTNFDQNHNETDKNQPTREEEKAENATQNLSEVPKNFNQTLAINTLTESKKETSSRREINDEKVLKINRVQKVVKSAKPNDTLKEDPKISTLDTSNPNQTEKKSDKNKNTETNTSEHKHESKTNVNATAKMEEAVHIMKTTFDQNHHDIDKNQPSREEEEKAEDAIQNLSEVPPENVNQSLAACNQTGSPKETSSRKEINDQAEFANEHNLTYNEGKGNAFCRLCNVRLPAHLKSMKEHVKGTNHTNKVKLKYGNIAKNKKDNFPKTIPTDKFLRQIHSIRTRHGQHVILNDKFFLTLHSYSMITNNMNILRCQVCEVNLLDGIERHLDTSTHETAIDKTPVVQKLNGEFVREVRSGLFHCGFCNLIVGVWENVSVHLQCDDHVKNKIVAGLYLREYLPQILEAQWRRQLDFNLLVASLSSHHRQRGTYSRFMPSFKVISIPLNNSLPPVLPHPETVMETMESKLHQNAILTGYVDAYCLICESLHRAEDIFNHIDKPIHKKNLDAAPYVTKYKDEFIRKVKKGYYCELCNIVFTTATKVNLHIAKATHIQNKGAPVLKRIGNSVIAINDICINEKAWNGLIEDICALCNLEFCDENIHKTEENHILNLIQKKVQFLDKKAVYRMVDNESFQCLTCNMIFAQSAIETHFNEDNHKNIFQKCREGKSEPPIIVQQSDEKALKILEHVQEVKNTNLNDTPKEIPNKSTLIIPNTQTEQKSGNNNTKTNKSESKYESKTNVNATATMEEATGHIMKPSFDQDHNEEKTENITQNLPEVSRHFDQSLEASLIGSPKATSSRKGINDLAEFANEHNLTYNEGNDNVFCRICNVRLPASLKSMKEHVNGINHTNKVKEKMLNIPKNKAISKYRTIPMNKFVKQLCGFKGQFVDHVVVNNEYCLTAISYSMVTLTTTQRCQVCDMHLNNSEEHLYSLSHINALEITPVVRGLDGEFVREVRPGLFHCGFCNLIVEGWDNVLVHLHCDEHIKSKSLARYCLKELFPDIMKH